MTTSPKFGLSYLVGGQAGAEVDYNDLVNHFEALGFLKILDRNLTAPPGSPSDLDTYLIPSGATGAWASNVNDITFYSGGWNFVTPVDGMRGRIVDENLDVAYDDTADEWYATNGSVWPAAETYMGWKTPSGNKVYRQAWRDIQGGTAGTDVLQAHGKTITFTDHVVLTGSLRIPSANIVQPIPQIAWAGTHVTMTMNQTNIIVQSALDLSASGFNGKYDLFLEFTK